VRGRGPVLFLVIVAIIMLSVALLPSGALRAPRGRCGGVVGGDGVELEVPVPVPVPVPLQVQVQV
jgi:hypothetical protein